MSKAVCTVYRTFFRYARQLQAASQILDIRQPVDKEAWQTAKHSWIVNDAASRKDALHQLMPDITQVPAHGSFTPDALRRCICANFAASKDASTDEQGLLLDRAFSALRILSEQMHMQQCSCHAVTGGIQVEVTSAFIGKVPASPMVTSTRNMFTYRVRITNIGDQKAQLMSRKWTIEDDKGNVVDQVAGPGVVGNTPVLKPYDCFQYYSSASLESMQGAMYGTFQMLGYNNHEIFDAQIPPFKMIAS